MKRLGLGGLIFLLAMGFLFLAFDALVTTAEAATKPTANQTTGTPAAPAEVKPAATSETASSVPSATEVKAGENKPDCITEAAAVILNFMQNTKDRTILDEQLKISVMKLAIDTMENKTKVAEDLVKKAEADIEEKDANNVLDKLTSVYEQYGLHDDLKKVHEKFNNRKYTLCIYEVKDKNGKKKKVKKPCKKGQTPWAVRFGSRDISSYVQTKLLLQENETQSGGEKKYTSGSVRYAQVDAAIFWLRSEITDAMDEFARQNPTAKNVKNFKVGSAVRNQEELTWKVAFLTGYMKDIKAMTPDQMKKEIANSKSRIAGFFQSAAEELKTKLKDKCPEAFINSAICPDCGEASDQNRETVSAEVIRQILRKIKTDKNYLDEMFLKDLRKKAGIPDALLETETTDGTGAVPEDTKAESRTVQVGTGSDTSGAGASGKTVSPVPVKPSSPDHDSHLENPRAGEVDTTAESKTTQIETGKTNPAADAAAKKVSVDPVKPASPPNPGSGLDTDTEVVIPNGGDVGGKGVETVEPNSTTDGKSDVKGSRTSGGANDRGPNGKGNGNAKSGKKESTYRESGRNIFDFTSIGLDRLRLEGQKILEEGELIIVTSEGEFAVSGLEIPNTKGCQLFFTKALVQQRGSSDARVRYFATVVQTTTSGRRVAVNTILQNDQDWLLFGGNNHISEHNGQLRLNLQGSSTYEVVQELMQNYAPLVDRYCRK